MAASTVKATASSPGESNAAVTDQAFDDVMCRICGNSVVLFFAAQLLPFVPQHHLEPAFYLVTGALALTSWSPFTHTPADSGVRVCRRPAWAPPGLLRVVASLRHWAWVALLLAVAGLARSWFYQLGGVDEAEATKALKLLFAIAIALLHLDVWSTHGHHSAFIAVYVSYFWPCRPRSKGTSRCASSVRTSCSRPACRSCAGHIPCSCRSRAATRASRPL